MKLWRVQFMVTMEVGDARESLPTGNELIVEAERLLFVEVWCSEALEKELKGVADGYMVKEFVPLRLNQPPDPASLWRDDGEVVG